MFGSRVLGAPVQGTYDVAVIGGGISGVQIARHAAGRGLRTILLERNDFCSGTSAATTKAIHGGLRYLEQYDFPVVWESVRERRYLGIAAPHLVQPRSFLLTAYDWSTPPAPVLGAGVALYEAMAWNRNAGVPRDLRSRRFRWVGRDALLRRVPWLDPSGLVGAWRHDDTLSVHPERLLLALLQSFVDDGGTAVNHAEVTGVLRSAAAPGSPARGVTVHDRLTGQDAHIRASVTVNAAGPWVEDALGELAGTVGVKVRQAKGVHLVTRDLGNRDGLYVRGRNGRHIVVNPWEGRCLIGPTDTPSAGTADDARATPDDVDLLLETIDSVSATPLDRDAILTTLVGVRPLVDDGTETYSSSRRFDVVDHAGAGVPGLFTVTGGKWTTGRAMGEKVVDTVVTADRTRNLLPPVRHFDSRALPVSGAFGDFDRIGDAFDSALRRFPELQVPRATRLHLARLYGTAHENVLALVAADPALAAPLDTGRSSDIAAQVVYAATDEAAATLRDVVDRRLTLGTLGPVPQSALLAVADILVSRLGWDAADLANQVSAYINDQDAVAAVLDSARRRSP
jgi:glycerol-3-phosphate dehydrogenase